MGHNIKFVSVGYIAIETPPLVYRLGDSTVMHAFRSSISPKLL
jgi:hypothetical protein